ncbi:hypothetical protein CMQ_6479 [Grosmannia clavigera kw1407]|uniref:HNH nuclease domain-containing protein n=1 Tax=Grosmannia clavigera (strain kw1407 / UAMH 11150) TaxID=655863 RepID=F0XL82_GROCL|nr:uncharacterized protein CMQ_6479 [Grosmannia clavigera kw1407]EFX01537.1 hypothetical protein CMQ_6479 [Grosmannia clavigera kw1407]
MSWNSPLAHLPPLSEHPSVSPSLSPAISDGSLAILGASVRLDQFEERSYSASRVIRAFLDHLEDDGKRMLVADIAICDDDDALVKLANHLIDAILKPFKLAGGQAPTPLSLPQTPGAEHAIDVAMATIETSTRQEQQHLRDDCLHRDGYRCVYSGNLDMNSCEKGDVVVPPGAQTTITQCAHIIPFALGSFDDTDAVQTRNKAIIWFAIHRYFPAIRDKIDTRSIKQRDNAIILDIYVHGLFGGYNIGFLPQGLNLYRITKFFTYAMSVNSKSGSPLVEFTSHDHTVPMPDADFLMTHYIISQILQVSGIGRQLDKAVEMALVDLDCHALHLSGSTDVGNMISRRLLMTVRTGFGDSKD